MKNRRKNKRYKLRKEYILKSCVRSCLDRHKSCLEKLGFKDYTEYHKEED